MPRFSAGKCAFDSHARYLKSSRVSRLISIPSPGESGMRIIPLWCSKGVFNTACRNGFSVRSNSKIGSSGSRLDGANGMDAIACKLAAICTPVHQTWGTTLTPCICACSTTRLNSENPPTPHTSG